MALIKIRNKSPVLTGPAAAKGRLEGEVDVLLRVQPDDKRRDVDDLLANPAANQKQRYILGNQ